MGDRASQDLVLPVRKIKWQRGRQKIHCSLVIDGIQYERIGDARYELLLFEAHELLGYINQMIKVNLQFMRRLNLIRRWEENSPRLFHVIRFKLQQEKIHSSWSSRREFLSTRNRITVTMQCYLARAFERWQAGGSWRAETQKIVGILS